MGHPGAKIRRYAVGVATVAILGAFCLGAFTWWSRSVVDSLFDGHLRSEAVIFAKSFRQRLIRHLSPSKPAAAAQTWAELDSSLEEEFAGLPYLVGIVVRAADGRTTMTVVGPIGLQDAAFVAADPAAPDGLTVRLLGEVDGVRPAAVGFNVTTPGGTDFARVTVHLRLAGALAEKDAFSRTAIVGTVALGLIIYLLAVLAVLIQKFGVGAMNLEREKSARLRALGEVAGGIAHELRNPLNAIGLSVQVMERGARTAGEAGFRPRDFERVHTELGKIKKVVDGFVKFARLGDLSVARFDLAELVADTIARFQPVLDDAHITLGCKLDGPTVMDGDRAKLGEVFSTVLQNAVDAICQSGAEQPGGVIQITVRGRGREVRLAVRDTGDVLDDERIRSIFEPAWSARDHAMGLGLTAARTFVECHGGTMEAAPAQGGGCVVTITLPRHAMAG